MDTNLRCVYYLSSSICRFWSFISCGSTANVLRCITARYFERWNHFDQQLERRIVIHGTNWYEPFFARWAISFWTAHQQCIWWFSTEYTLRWIRCDWDISASYFCEWRKKVHRSQISVHVSQIVVWSAEHTEGLSEWISGWTEEKRHQNFFLCLSGVLASPLRLCSTLRTLDMDCS